MSTILFILRQTLNFSVPLLVVAIGGTFSARSGVSNIGLEGMMVFGAMCSYLFINLSSTYWGMSGQWQLLIAILISMVSGVAISLLHAFSAINLQANQIISGAALNIFTPALAVFVDRLIFNNQMIRFDNTFRITSFPLLGKIPIIGDILFTNCYITTYIAIAILFIANFVLFKTQFGLRLRACGEYPQAPDSVGINVAKMRYFGVAISGALSGFGGLVYILPNSTQFNCTVNGYGFLAMACMMFGQWKPYKIFFASLLFGITSTFASSYSSIAFLQASNISQNYFKMIPYIITILVMALSRNNSNAPKSEGKPFEKGMR
ncbi:MAG: ABC transporter permease [Oscillospiraceae bacterium]|nr:ABC transporter permease [Oscillospiraceae bacterium]